MKNIEPKKDGELFIGGNAQILITMGVIVGINQTGDCKMKEEITNKKSHLTDY